MTILFEVEGFTRLPKDLLSKLALIEYNPSIAFLNSCKSVFWIN